MKPARMPYFMVHAASITTMNKYVVERWEREKQSSICVVKRQN